MSWHVADLYRAEAIFEPRFRFGLGGVHLGNETA